MSDYNRERVRDRIAALRDQIARVYLGDTPAIDWLICCLLSRGHVLLEDVPGVGKTLLASTLAKSIDCPFSRVQLTPDMLPADLLGVSIYARDGAELKFQPGPIFTSVLLADEINRTTPRTQSALLEAMSEAQASVERTAGGNATEEAAEENTGGGGAEEAAEEKTGGKDAEESAEEKTGEEEEAEEGGAVRVVMLCC